MKKKQFYSHIIETSSLSLELGNLKLSQEERVHLITLADANIHAEILDKVLSELSNEDKKVFLENLLHDEHDKTLSHLKEKVEDLEDKIRDSAENVKKELLEDIVKLKKLT